MQQGYYKTLAEMNKLVRECEYKLKSSAPKHVSLPTIGSFCYDLLEANLDPKKRKGTSGPLSKASNTEARDQWDAEVARMFYTSGYHLTLQEIHTIGTHMFVLLHFQGMLHQVTMH